MRRALGVLTVVIALGWAPASASAAFPRACGVLPAVQVGKGLHGHPERFTTGGALRGDRSSATLAVSTCRYCQRVCKGWPEAWLVVAALFSEPEASEEFAWEIARAKTNGYPAREIKGPWQRAFEFGDLEVYALIGKRIVHFQFVQTYPAKRHHPRGAAARIAAAVSRQEPRSAKNARITVPGVRARGCPYLTARLTAHALGLDRLQSSEGVPTISPGNVADEITIYSCDFQAGPALQLPAVWFTAEVFDDAAAARDEYRFTLERTRKDGYLTHRVAGPWDRADSTGGGQAYALEGATILQFQPIGSQPYRSGAALKVLRTIKRKWRPVGVGASPWVSAR